MSFDRHCEQSEATQRPWVAAPLLAARDDGMDGSSWLTKHPQADLDLAKKRKKEVEQ